MTLYGEFLDNQLRQTHKWYQYFPVYERHFERFRNRHLTLFEIGVGAGGSVQQWRRYFGPFAIIVGIDINPLCGQVEEDQVHIRIGSQDDPAFIASTLTEFGDPDIVIDDGSHQQRHVNATFDLLYPRVAKNGVYLVEDLHAAYWEDHGGGVRHEGSFIEHAKNCVDEMHAEYTRGVLARTRLGDRTTSIHFYDSIVVFEVGEYRSNRGNAHSLTGRPDLWRFDWVPPGEAGRVGAPTVGPLQQEGENVTPPAVALPLPPESDDEEQAVADRLARLESQPLRGPRSWSRNQLRKIARRIKRTR